jgi:hypothetical protein
MKVSWNMSSIFLSYFLDQRKHSNELKLKIVFQLSAITPDASKTELHFYPSQQFFSQHFVFFFFCFWSNYFCETSEVPTFGFLKKHTFCHIFPLYLNIYLFLALANVINLLTWGCDKHIFPPAMLSNWPTVYYYTCKIFLLMSPS